MTGRSFSSRYWNSLLTRNVEKPPGEDLWSRYVAELLDTPLAYRQGRRSEMQEEEHSRSTTEEPYRALEGTSRNPLKAAPFFPIRKFPFAFFGALAAIFFTYTQTGDVLFTAILSILICTAGLIVDGAVERAKNTGRTESAIFESAVTVTSEQLGILALNHPKDHEILKQIISKLTETAAIAAHPKAKSAFYSLERVNSLRLIATNAPSEFTSVFNMDSENGKFMHQIARNSRIRRISDPTKDPDNYRIDLPGKYRAAWICPVLADKKPYGLLVVEVPKLEKDPDSIESKLRLVTFLMSAAYAIRTSDRQEPGMLPQQGRSEVQGSLPSME